MLTAISNWLDQPASNASLLLVVGVVGIAVSVTGEHVIRAVERIFRDREDG